VAELTEAQNDAEAQDTAARKAEFASVIWWPADHVPRASALVEVGAELPVDPHAVAAQASTAINAKLQFHGRGLFG
jgi:hypothetical protein